MDAHVTQDPTAEMFKDVPSEMLQTLMQIGFVAANKGMIARTRSIFDGICAVRPNSEEATMGKAMSMVFSGKLSEPCEMLSALSKAHPNNDLARAFFLFVIFLGKAYASCGPIAEEIILTSNDPEAIAIARAVQEELSKRNLLN